mmetsp:Transcript_13353/g.18232  ORF Transcript_13353/g.18232 Transcript_13353/m.18232 type:complete len:102 (-) Transcript_13353:823-1128(-)|eukprot:CAMPEP_0170450806 /NCGR_PEP_ID=MMETSP0123-20130129/229_1 /TAXON_ID=182087 /ORGANISM="Favella ehrenbergii, Strain Fehren 1" /LENGTH=101 /DNA_ID=CAMNT_0010712229 /DNA_START=493 /DNA_END=798 /DNA_ORIENTATION=+
MTGMPRGNGEQMSPDTRKVIQSQLTDFSATPGKKANEAGNNLTIGAGQTKNGGILNLVSSKSSVNSRNAVGEMSKSAAGHLMKGGASGMDQDAGHSLNASS